MSIDTDAAIITTFHPDRSADADSAAIIRIVEQRGTAVRFGASFRDPITAVDEILIGEDGSIHSIPSSEHGFTDTLSRHEMKTYRVKFLER